MKLGFWLVGAVAVAMAALISSVVEGHRASQDEAMRDSVLAASAVHAAADAAIKAHGDSAAGVADSLGRVADSLGRRVGQLLTRHPPVAPPAPTATDSSRYWRDSATVAQATAQEALGALEVRGRQVETLEAALDSQRVATGLLRQAYTGEHDRAEGLATALRRMPTGCQKILGLPAPRLGVGYGMTTKGLSPVVAVVIPLGC